MEPKFKHEVHLYMCFIDNPEVILHNVFSVLAFYRTVSMKPGIEFSSYGILLILRTFWIWDFGLLG